MKRIFLLTVVVALLLGHRAYGLELKNLVLKTGPVGSTRTQAKFLPGDYLYLTLDISGVKVDPKTGMAQYKTTMQIFDDKGEEVFQQESPEKKILLLGGDNLPSAVVAFLGADQDPGKYLLKITVEDLLAKKEKSLEYEFQVLPKAFGIVQPVMPTLSWSGQDYTIAFSIVGMKRTKEKFPDVEFSVQVEDEYRREVFPKPISLHVMQLNDPALNDLRKKSVIPIYVPLFLNQPGNYTIVIEANDKIAEKKVTKRFPLRILDLDKYTGN